MSKKVIFLVILLLVGGSILFSKKNQKNSPSNVVPSLTNSTSKTYRSSTLGVSFNYPALVDDRLVKVEEDANKIFIFTEDRYKSDSASKVIEVLTLPNSNLISFIETNILKGYSLSNCQIKTIDDRSITKVGIINNAPTPSNKSNGVLDAIAYGKYIRKCPVFYTNYTNLLYPNNPFPLQYFLQHPSFPKKIIFVSTGNLNLEISEVNYWQDTQD